MSQLHISFNSCLTQPRWYICYCLFFCLQVNEAFAAQCLAVSKELGLDNAITNSCGGAIALGHPLAASGSRILAHLTHQLRRINQRYAIGGACIGGGQGIAVILERVWVLSVVYAHHWSDFGATHCVSTSKPLLYLFLRFQWKPVAMWTCEYCCEVDCYVSMVVERRPLSLLY